MIRVWCLPSCVTQAAFPADENVHYHVTPCDITLWLSALQHYDWENKTLLLGDAVVHEAMRVFRDRLVDEAARSKFDLLLASTLIPHLKQCCVNPKIVYSTLGVSEGDRLKGNSAGQVLSKWSLDDFHQMVRQTQHWSAVLLFSSNLHRIFLRYFDTIHDTTLWYKRSDLADLLANKQKNLLVRYSYHWY